MNAIDGGSGNKTLYGLHAQRQTATIDELLQATGQEPVNLGKARAYEPKPNQYTGK